jgi:hypothetical protein
MLLSLRLVCARIEDISEWQLNQTFAKASSGSNRGNNHVGRNYENVESHKGSQKSQKKLLGELPVIWVSHLPSDQT